MGGTVAAAEGTDLPVDGAVGFAVAEGTDLLVDGPM